MKSVTSELLDHLGDASAPQRLLVQSAAVKATRLALLTEMLLDGRSPSETSDQQALAWLNSMRMDLVALGLERKPVKSLDLNAYLREQAEAGHAAA